TGLPVLPAVPMIGDLKSALQLPRVGARMRHPVLRDQRFEHLADLWRLPRSVESGQARTDPATGGYDRQERRRAGLGRGLRSVAAVHGESAIRLGARERQDNGVGVAGLTSGDVALIRLGSGAVRVGGHAIRSPPICDPVLCALAIGYLAVGSLAVGNMALG